MTEKPDKNDYFHLYAARIGVIGLLYLGKEMYTEIAKAKNTLEEVKAAAPKEARAMLDEICTGLVIAKEDPNAMVIRQSLDSLAAGTGQQALYQSRINSASNQMSTAVNIDLGFGAVIFPLLLFYSFGMIKETALRAYRHNIETARNIITSAYEKMQKL
jgi:hypothetical protein